MFTQICSPIAAHSLRPTFHHMLFAMMRYLRKPAVLAVLGGLSLVAILLLQLKPYIHLPFLWRKPSPSWPQAHTVCPLEKISQKLSHIPYRDVFGELGERVKIIRECIRYLDTQPSSSEQQRLRGSVEAAALELFPFLANSPRSKSTRTPLTELRNSFAPGTKGIVITTGSKSLRYTFHLIATLKSVLQSQLPIQVFYSGDEDLHAAERARLTWKFDDIDLVDITTLLDERKVKLGEGGWAIKAFAALTSSFEQLILMDADSVFLQQPEVLFTQKEYISNGVLLFHDRLIWQHAFSERHSWWKSQIRFPSKTLNKSLVWTDDYAEEEDSGVVVVDKSRLDVFMALLHIAWQNSPDVREEVTYRLMYGDKESWWLGFELTGAGYAFEKSYATMIGWPQADERGPKVCSFTIGHLDEKDMLLWWNGGLLKNKRVDPRRYEVPTHWMVNGTWEKSGNTNEMSCMRGEEAQELSQEQRHLLGWMIQVAEDMDAEFQFV